ncbi:hypothetical protein NQZ68_039224 [Dissostichus eleginoides]|nr:hypothetical protein NQZ68_039224 [Dissostichus eleginoides]
MTLDLSPDERSDRTVRAPEVNISVFMLILSQSGHRGQAGFLLLVSSVVRERTGVIGLRKQSFARDCVDVCELLYYSVCVGSTTFPLSQIISLSSAGIQASRNTVALVTFGPSRSL